MLLNIRNVIGLARTLTDSLSESDKGISQEGRRAGVLFRNELLEDANGRHDAEGEDYLRDLAGKLKLPDFRLVSVLHGVLPATRKRLAAFRGVDEIDIQFERLTDTDHRTSLYSYVDNSQPVPSVVYRSDLKLCWLRFAIAKELMHLFSGTAGPVGQSTPESIARTALYARQRVSRAKNNFWDVVPAEDSPMDDETSVIFLTMEVMFAWRLREQFLELRKETAGIETLQYYIAKAFMIPQAFVDHFCQDFEHGINNYSAVSYRLNREYDALSRIERESWLPVR